MSSLRARTTTRTVLGGAIGVLAVTLAGCGDQTSPSGSATDPAGPGTGLPTNYTMVLDSSCGERSLFGAYDVEVVEGHVVRAVPQSDGAPTPDVDEVPSLVDLEHMADRARAGGASTVELTHDAQGRPSALTIDHDEMMVDEEECYRVSDLVVTTP